MRSSLRSFLVLALGLPTSAWAADAQRIDLLFDTSGSMRDAQAPLISMIQTLNWSLVFTPETEKIADVTLSLAGFCENAEHIQVGDSDVFDATQWEDAARALGRQGRGCLGEEDGLNALDAALQSRPKDQPGHVLLITDEPRSAVHDDIDAIALLKTLYERRLVLDAMLGLSLRCGDGRRALGMTQNGVGYVAQKGGTFDQCTDARFDPAPTTTVTDYASLAIASGGSVWDVNALRPRVTAHQNSRWVVEAMAQSYASAVLDRRRWRSTTRNFMARPMVSATRVMVGEALGLDGQLSVGSRPDLGVYEWRWDVDGDNGSDYFGPNASHTYQAPGVYPLTLFVVDSDGQRDQRTLWIGVYSP